MKYLAFIISILGLLVGSSAAFGCDEKCKKEEAQATHNVSFPGYLSWGFCEDTRMQFMASAIPSLEKYRDGEIDTRYKGPLKNIKSFVNQRKDWLAECDEYLKLTGKGRIFDDSKTTGQIFAAMDSVTKELDALIAGATYSNEYGDDSAEQVRSRFDSLLKLVDDHKTLMHLKGKYVSR